MRHPFFDTTKFPARRAEAIELHRVLCILYSGREQIELIYQQCSPDLPGLTLPASVIDLWHEALRNLAKAPRGLRRLCELVKDSYARNPAIQSAILAIETAEPTFSAGPVSDSLFIGREKELEQFRELFERNSIIAVTGPARVGKTSFVRECVKRFVDNQENIIWIYPDVALSFKDFIAGAGYKGAIEFDTTERAMYRYIAILLERDEKIIVFEDFEALDPGFSNFIIECRGLRRAKIILVGRSVPLFTQLSIPTIRLGDLDSRALFELAENLQRANVERGIILTQEDIHRIYESTQSLGLSRQIIMQLINGGLSANEIIRRISLQLPDHESTFQLRDVIQNILDREPAETPKLRYAKRNTLVLFPTPPLSYVLQIPRQKITLNKFTLVIPDQS